MGREYTPQGSSEFNYTNQSSEQDMSNIIPSCRERTLIQG